MIRYIGAFSFREKEKAINIKELMEAIQTPAIITRHRIVKEHFGTTTLEEFIERVKESNALDSLDFVDSGTNEEVSTDKVDLSEMDSTEFQKMEEEGLKDLNAF